MRSPTPRPGRTTQTRHVTVARTVALAVGLPLGLVSLSACTSDLRLQGPSQTVTIAAPATATIKGKRLTVETVRAGGATIDVAGSERVLRPGDTFTVEGVKFTIDSVDDAKRTATVTGAVEVNWPWHL
jgi:hypothetical protein